MAVYRIGSNILRLGGGGGVLRASSPSSGGTVVAALSASILTGPVPLAVHFDGHGTTDSAVSDPNRELAYSFNFGDPGSGTYTQTGNSKNVSRGGPTAAHVFETEGTFTVKMMVYNPVTGHYDQASVTIIATSQDAAFPSTQTICVDPGGTTGWGPGGATYVTSMPANLTTKNRRYFVKRGSTIGGFEIERSMTDIMVLPHGAGADPIVTGLVQFHNFNQPAGTPGEWPTRIVLDGLQLNAELTQQGCARHILLKNLKFLAGVVGNDTDILLGRAVDNFANNTQNAGWDITDYYYPRNIFVVGCQLLGDGTNNANIFGPALESAFMDNETHWVEAGAHDLRLTLGYKTFISNNNLRGRSGDGARHCLKVHGGGINELVTPDLFQDEVITKWVHVVDNKIGGSDNNNAWLVSIRPESAGHVNGQEDILLIRNQFDQSGADLEVQALCRRLTLRGNTILGGGSLRVHFIEDVSDGGYDPSLAPFCGPYFNDVADLTYMDPV